MTEFSQQGLLTLADDLYRFLTDQLLQFNRRQVKLFHLHPQQRILLFILTRSMKTYSSIIILCRGGYGQDAASLLRSLLEHLVTAGYILRDPAVAKDRARRFVAYKWVIFKRQLTEEEARLPEGNAFARAAFEKRHARVLEGFQRFRSDFQISSDRALLTWSGKTLRDMAREVDRQLLLEYETTFRLCSRFAHPTILGDHEYMIYEDETLTFSPLPSDVGIQSMLCRSVAIFVQMLELVANQFSFSASEELRAFKERLHEYRSLAVDEASSVEPPFRAHALRASSVRFRIEKKANASRSKRVT